MLSVVIRARRSYRAMPRAWQLVHQRSVHSGPLVLRTDLLKIRAPAVDRRPTCLTHLYFTSTSGVEPSLLKGLDYSFIHNYCELLTFSLYGLRVHLCRVNATLAIQIPSVLPSLAWSGSTEISQLLQYHFKSIDRRVMYKLYMKLFSDFQYFLGEVFL